mmetsp:Transcript_59950/g.154893  ORF Transcript_59950/g.154893 Transcript_59950/m.154893 type:complete len:87 (+) Transcript_59950:226-486(+)
MACAASWALAPPSSKGDGCLLLRPRYCRRDSVSIVIPVQAAHGDVNDDFKPNSSNAEATEARECEAGRELGERPSPMRVLPRKESR